MTVLVTGATGFVGSGLCACLRQTDVTFRPLSKGGAALPDGTPTQAVNLNDAAALAPVLSGVQSVCHLAGIAHQQAAESDYELLNVQASLTLAEAALKAGAEHFVYLSSVKAMGPSLSAVPRTETMVNASSDSYGRSKYRAEQQLEALCAGSGMALTILRPTLVYGASPKGNLRLLARAARWGLPSPPTGGGRSMIGRDDLAELLVKLVQDPPEGVNTWIVSDGQSYTARGIYNTLREAMGSEPGRDWLPRAGWKFACGAMDKFRGEEGAYQKLMGVELYDSRALQLDTGWSARQSLGDVASAMVEAV